GGGDLTASRTISLSHLGLESLSDPNADRIVFWDDSAGSLKWLTAGSGLSISNTTISVNQGAIDHGSLSGLGDDDHTQYLLVNGSRSMTGSLLFGSDNTYNLASSSNRVKCGYFVNVVMDGLIETNYLTEKHDELDFISSQHMLSAWIAMVADTITYGTIEEGTKIYKNGELIVSSDTPSTGTFSVSQGDIITSNNKPIALVADGSQHSIAPISLAGKYFGFTTNRYDPHTIYIYSPFGTAYVEYYRDAYQGGTPEATLTIHQGEIETITTTSTSGTYQHRIYSTAPIVVTQSGSGGDMDIIPPASHEVLLSQTPDGSGTMFNGTISNIDNNYFYSDDDLVYVTAIADGAGSDTDSGLPWKACGDVYIIPHAIDGYAIIALEPTIVRVYYWSSSTWNLYKEHDLTGASRTNPIRVEEGTQDGDGTNIITDTPILVIGTRPFYKTILFENK
ncbi:MAG: hypothetical protein ACTSPI_18165, partial [Candidatus Heimdallarchaeaceae archaeon]